MSEPYGSRIFTSEERQAMCADTVHEHAVLGANAGLLARLDAFAKELEAKLATTKDEIVISIPAPCSKALANAARSYVMMRGLLCFGDAGCNFYPTSGGPCDVIDKSSPITFTVDIDNPKSAYPRSRSEALNAFFAARADQVEARNAQNETMAREIDAKVVQALKGNAHTPLTYVFDDPERQPVSRTAEMLKELGYYADCPGAFGTLLVAYDLGQMEKTTSILARYEIEAMREAEKSKRAQEGEAGQ